MQRSDIAPQIEQFRKRLTGIEAKLSDPAVYADQKQSRMLSRERQRILDLIALYESWCKSLDAIAANHQMLQSEQDSDFRALIESDIAGEEAHASQAEQDLLLALLPPDPNDSRDIIMELHSAAGGEESALFAAEMFRAYTKYAERRNWHYSLMDLAETELGGIKDVTFSLSGDSVFSRLKYESGVHRVQRVPATEASGRIHTSTITISVLPEADETDDVEIRQEDLEISTFRSSGPGGQNVNRTDSAVRIRHIPSGIVVASQQERSQIRNREIALRILKSKLLEIIQREEAAKQAASKRQQVGAGDRSERVRTYNFPQNRVTDHRFGVSAHDLPSLMEGNFDLILDPIFAEERKLLIQDLLEEKL